MQPASQPLQKLLSSEEVSTILGVSVGTLAVWRSTRRYPLKFIKVGGLVRYRECDLSEFVELQVRGVRRNFVPRKSRRRDS
jgi:predicted DNA-binding transcriptional regulator AlpA